MKAVSSARSKGTDDMEMDAIAQYMNMLQAHPHRFGLVKDVHEICKALDGEKPIDDAKFSEMNVRIERILSSDIAFMTADPDDHDTERYQAELENNLLLDQMRRAVAMSVMVGCRPQRPQLPYVPAEEGSKGWRRWMSSYLDLKDHPNLKNPFDALDDLKWLVDKLDAIDSDASDGIASLIVRNACMVDVIAMTTMQNRVDLYEKFSRTLQQIAAYRIPDDVLRSIRIDRSLSSDIGLVGAGPSESVSADYFTSRFSRRLSSDRTMTIFRMLARGTKLEAEPLRELMDVQVDRMDWFTMYPIGSTYSIKQALLHGAIEGQSMMIEGLLNACRWNAFDPNAPIEGRRPLHWAIDLYNPEMVAMLLQNGAEHTLRMTGSEGPTPLQHARDRLLSIDPIDTGSFSSASRICAMLQSRDALLAVEAVFEQSARITGQRLRR